MSTQEIGFVQLGASVFGRGMLDNKIPMCDNYLKEKARVQELLKILSGEISVSESSAASPTIIYKLAEAEISRWWNDSRYNVQVGNQCAEIMNCLHRELCKSESKIINVGARSITVTDFSPADFDIIQSSIEKNYPGVYLYCKL